MRRGLAVAACLVAGCDGDDFDPNGPLAGVRWAITLGDQTNDEGKAVVIDSQGDVIVAGLIGDQSFITKRAAATGAQVWTLQLPTATASSGADVIDLAIGANDTVVGLGSFRGTVDFGGMSLTGPADRSTTFVATYGADGGLRWVNGLTDFAQPASIAVDSAGNVYVTGQFWSSTLDFGGKVFTETNHDADSFVASYDAQGALRWGTAFQGTATTGVAEFAGPWATELAIAANGDVLVTGSFYDPVSFGGPSIQADSRVRTFVARLHADGSYASAQAIGPVAPYSATVGNVAVDTAGRLAIQEIEQDDTNAGSEHTVVRVLDDAMQEVWTSTLEDDRLTQRTLATTSAGLIVSSGWWDRFSTSDPSGGLDMTSFDADGAESSRTIGARLVGSPSATMVTSTAAGSGVLAHTGKFGGKINLGGGAAATHGDGDTDLFIVVVDN